MTPTKAWLWAALICVILEIIPPATHFFFLCLAFGALGASIAAFFSTTPWLPWIVFAILSIGLIPVLIPLAKFLFTPRPTPSNVDELIGQRAQVTDKLDGRQAGTVKIRGEVWRALSEGDEIQKDQWVQVIRVEGTHVIVRRD